MENITIHFKDYSPVNSISNEEKAKLAELFSNPKDESEKTNDEKKQKENVVIEKFCGKIKDLLSSSKAQNIELIETSSKPCLFSEFNGELYTQGYVGILSFNINDTKVTVHFGTRFDNEDFRFLMYIFERAFGLNGKIYEDLAVEGSKEKSWDFLLMILFVNQLRNAMKNGLYKQYQEFFYNDSNVKGRIDVAEHIRLNPLSNGKVAYITREFTANNYVNRLILKACGHFEKKYRVLFRKLISNDEICKKGIQVLKNEVEDWNAEKDVVVIKNANKKIVQSVYRNYEPLRKTAIAVLRRFGIDSFNNNGDSVDGMLIDMPKLWENFLHKELFCKILNQSIGYTQTSCDILIEEGKTKGKRELKPDFLYKDKGVVFDAKYKSHWEKDISDDNSWTGARDDVFQLLSYMYVFNCSNGGVIFPVSYDNKQAEQKCYTVGEEQKNAKFWTIPICVPNVDGNDIIEFRNKMDEQLEKIRNDIKEKIFDEIEQTN